MVPANTVAESETPQGLEDDEDGQARKLQVLNNEVKKVGVIIDRGQRMEFRPGDELIVYVSMGGFEK